MDFQTSNRNRQMQLPIAIRSHLPHTNKIIRSAAKFAKGFYSAADNMFN
ncbi:MAG: hypothetical protein H6Q73_4384 [Firmicutes bacterium]|nr:hypothetical protein [Bacillota bacterium]